MTVARRQLLDCWLPRFIKRIQSLRYYQQNNYTYFHKDNIVRISCIHNVQLMEV